MFATYCIVARVCMLYVESWLPLLHTEIGYLSVTDEAEQRREGDDYNDDSGAVGGDVVDLDVMMMLK